MLVQWRNEWVNKLARILLVVFSVVLWRSLENLSFRLGMYYVKWRLLLWAWGAHSDLLWLMMLRNGHFVQCPSACCTFRCSHAHSSQSLHPVCTIADLCLESSCLLSGPLIFFALDFCSQASFTGSPTSGPHCCSPALQAVLILYPQNSSWGQSPGLSTTREEKSDVRLIALLLNNQQENEGLADLSVE